MGRNELREGGGAWRGVYRHLTLHATLIGPCIGGGVIKHSLSLVRYCTQPGDISPLKFSQNLGIRVCKVEACLTYFITNLQRSDIMGHSSSPKSKVNSLSAIDACWTLFFRLWLPRVGGTLIGVDWIKLFQLTLRSHTYNASLILGYPFCKSLPFRPTTLVTVWRGCSDVLLVNCW